MMALQVPPVGRPMVAERVGRARQSRVAEVSLAEDDQNDQHRSGARRGELSQVTKWVYDFSEGDASQKYLLGGKGANLAEMTNIGLPVPPGFTITIRGVQRVQGVGGGFPEGLLDEVAEHRKHLEETMGRQIGDPRDPSARLGPLRRSVLDARDDGHGPERRAERRERRGAHEPDRIRPLRVGFLPTAAADVRQDRDGCGRRAVRGSASMPRKRPRASRTTSISTAKDLQGLVKTFKKIVKKETGRSSLKTQPSSSTSAIEAVFKSWDNKQSPGLPA